MADEKVAPEFVVYWIPYVGIGENPTVRVVVPLEGILEFQRADGWPQATTVILGAAKFTGTPQTFAPPYLDLGDIASVLTRRLSSEVGPVRKLQARGIKVLLSVMGPNVTRGMGWAHVPASKNEAFAQWVKKEVLDEYGLDGIDIDDEYSGWDDDPPQALVDTVAALKGAAPEALFHKALWHDADAFTTPVSTSSPWLPGAYLSQMLDLASTMNYGDDLAGLQRFVEFYTSIKVGKRNVGMTPSQLCLGVQAGSKKMDSWMTTLADTKAASKWVVANGYRGMMLYTFTSDIQQWTHWPPNAPGHMYPNPKDHAWQKAIAEAMAL